MTAKPPAIAEDPLDATGFTRKQPPTSEQVKVIEAPATKRLIILSGPGTGKTFTLVERAGALARDGQRPLVLSFTRAVVRELHHRLGQSVIERAKYIRPLTFDSFATRLLGGVPTLIEFRRWEHSGYDGRIAAARAALIEVPEATEWLTSSFSHLVVDEVQDLTGSRARLVRTLCDRIPSFSLFGDPAQGIYGWQDDADEYSADDFLDDIRESFPDAELRHLTFNHRATTEERRDVADRRTHLLLRDSAAKQYGELRRTIATTEPLGALENAVHLISMLPGRTALLCRTNVEALLASEQLFAAGVDHALRRAATDRAPAPWIAQVARGRRGALSSATFEELYGHASLRDDLDAADAWDLLAAISGADDRVALDRVADALRSGRLPDELNSRDDATVVVSTIHRAKGLEFDNVVIVQQEQWRDDTDDAEEARVLYVALTRARTRVGHVQPLQTFGWRQDQRIDRWYRCPPRELWKTLGIEIAGSDAHAMHPAGSYLQADDVAAVQRRLERVQRGDQVTLRLVHADDGDEPKASYAIHHEDGLLGVSGDDFGRLLARRLRARPNEVNRWPLGFSGVRVEGVDTAAGLEGLGADNGLGTSGMWLRVRVAGLGYVDWFDGTEGG